MKIIKVDNYGRESVADKLIADNVHSFYGQFIVDSLNKRYSDEMSFDFFKLAKDDYVLWRGMEELV